MPDFRTIHELAAGLAEGEYTSRDLAEASLEEIAKTDGVLKAWVAVSNDRALSEADASDKRRKEGKSFGPLDGIPYGAKDLYDTNGVETRSSSKVLSGRVPDRDCSAVARLRDAGAVLIG
jgi:Asp-tRNA(Asn)/Glu-tRNA(Gln) amidotransferase A subunit family amidase